MNQTFKKLGNAPLLGRVLPFLVLGLGTCIASLNSVQAQLTLQVQVGNNDLAANSVGQVVNLFIQNTGTTSADDVQVFGISFNVQIADGSTSTSAPNLTGVDILTGSVFASNNTGQQNPTMTVHHWNATTTTSSGAATLVHGTTTEIGQLTIDTTGFSSGSWALSLTLYNGGTHYFDNHANPIVPTITDGTITVVPEPNSAVGASCMLLAMVAFLRRKSLCSWALRRNFS